MDFWRTPEIPHAGVPALRMSDGPHGLRIQKGANDNLGVNSSLPATCFPTACALASSWDGALVEEVGAALGKEAALAGVGMVLGPGLCLKRDPLCGRNFEYFSEDPLLAGRFAASLIKGIQSAGIAACPKHFAVNNQETRRLTVDAVVDGRTLRELYLAAFEIAVKEGKPLSIMSSYNRINGVYANESAWLLKQVLRREWGFTGFTVTDWGAGNDRVAQLKAGGNLEMPGTAGETDREALSAVLSGAIEERELDERIDELLDTALIARAGIAKAGPVDREAHHALARRAAGESAVLLKNEGALLPLNKGVRAAVIGDFAKYPRYQGAGSSLVNPTRLDGYGELAKAGLAIVGYAKGFERYGKKSPRLAREACALAKKAEVVLLYLGLDEFSEAEGVDRAHMKLPENQRALLERLHEANPNIAVLLSCGSPIEMDWEKQAKAILQGNLGGQAMAGAFADAVTGKVNPSGKLAESYPMVYEDAPAAGVFPGGPVTSEYREGLYVGYRYYLTANVPVRYPFGYGLSYTDFALSELTFTEGQASLTLTNTGKHGGAEVVQIYVEPNTGGVYRPLRTLAGFKKVYLNPGEAKKVTIPLPERAFQYWNEQEQRWSIEAGEYRVLAGTSCQDTPLSLSVKLPGEEPKACPPVLEAYKRADVKHISDEAFEALLGHKIPSPALDLTRPLNENDTVETGGRRRGFPRFVLHLTGFIRGVCAFFGKRSEALYVGVALQMPYRSLCGEPTALFQRIC